MYAVEESWHDHNWGADGKCTECYVDKDDVTEDGEVEDGDYILSYYVPHTYGNIWFDGWVVPKTYNPDHAEAIKLFINFLNNPYVAAENTYTIGYSSAVAPEVVATDADARESLVRLYFVNAPEICELTEEDLAENDGEYGYDSWDEFAEEFFNYIDEIDDSNWRYPFVSALENEEVGRGLSTLGMMRDFGSKNADVVTMWNYARSAGVSALPVMLWTLLAVAVVVGVVALIAYIGKCRRKRVIVK